MQRSVGSNAQRSTGSKNNSRDLKSTGKQPTKEASVPSGFDRKTAPTPTQLVPSSYQIPKIQGLSSQCSPVLEPTDTDVPPKPDQEPPRKYSKGEQVYVLDDFGTDGTPTQKRLWICCMRYNAKSKVWEYRVKDKDGKSQGWYTERQLERLPTQI